MCRVEKRCSVNNKLPSAAVNFLLPVYHKHCYIYIACTRRATTVIRNPKCGCQRKVNPTAIACISSVSCLSSHFSWKEATVAMADISDTVEKGLEDLEEEITCPVCHEHFRDPKILPCLHYYCKECVLQLLIKAEPSSTFACPECRKATILPENDPDQLPTAFFVNRMKELHTKMVKAQGKVESICEMCSGAKAEAFCRQCAEFICEDCVRSHNYMKVFASHKVLTIEELKEEGAKGIPLKETPPLMCTDHDEQLKIFCFDCNRLICRDCIIYDHAGHTSEFVKKSAPRYKKAVKESLAPLAKIETNILGATAEVEEVEGEISEQCNTVPGTIEQSFKKLHEILLKREKQLLDKASELRQQKLDNLGAQKKDFAQATSEIQSLVEFVERSIENATDEEFMLLQHHIQEQIQEQCAKHESIDLLPAEAANVGVRVACADGISDLCLKFADLIILRVDPRKCTAEGPGTKVAEVSKLAQFTVHTVYQNGQLCGEKQVVEAKLKSVVNDSVTHAKVTSKGRGVYEVTYTPEVRGRHTLIVKVNGTQIAGSPFRVFAKIHPTQLGEPVRVIKGLVNPWGIALNSKQELVVAERGGKVTVFDKESKKAQTITSEEFLHTMGVAVDKDDNIYVSDSGKSSLFKFSEEGNFMIVTSAQDDEFGFIKVINDKLYVCDRKNHRIQILNTELEYIDSFGCHGDGDGQFHWPNGIAQDEAGNLYVSDSNNNRVQVFVQVFDHKGQFFFFDSFSEKGTTSNKLNFPIGICVGSDQLVYVCDTSNKCVSVFKTSGEFVTSFGQFSCPTGIVTDDDGFVYVSDYETKGKVYIL